MESVKSVAKKYPAVDRRVTSQGNVDLSRHLVTASCHGVLSRRSVAKTEDLAKTEALAKTES